VLRKAGAAKVWVATVARTLKLASKYQDLNVTEFQGVEAAQTDEIESLEAVNS
jgi:hypothetical protein